jgi:PAS domain S-box-containing protein
LAPSPLRGFLGDERFRTIFESTPVPACNVDLKGVFIAANHAFQELLGYAEEELRARRFADITHPDDLVENLERFKAQLATDQSFRMEKRYLRKDGQVVWVDVSSSLVAGRPGEPATGVAFAVDITERRRAEEALRQSQKMEAIGRLAGGIAHDFNNLLTAINGYCELVLLREDLDAGVRADVEQVAQAGARAAGLTRQLLAFGRRQALRPAILDLNEVVASTERMLCRLIGEDVELETSLEPSLGSIRADPGQLEQVIVNLAINARDAMPTGGRLGIETRNVALEDAEIPPLPSGRYVTLAVADSGIGMDAETRAQVFEPFFTTKETGSGLGLATVHGIVTQSGGGIAVESAPRAGARFTIYLPRID